jgi:hypothetical protein
MIDSGARTVIDIYDAGTAGPGSVIGNDAVFDGNVLGCDLEAARYVLTAYDCARCADLDRSRGRATIRREHSAGTLREIWTGICGPGPTTRFKVLPDRMSAIDSLTVRYCDGHECNNQE